LALELLEQAPPGAAPEVQAARARFQRLYLAARAETIYAGTTEIQLGIIGDRILGLPRERARGGRRDERHDGASRRHRRLRRNRASGRGVLRREAGARPREPARG
ncbi:MAG: hypothetical protein J0H57_01105, partial [Rhodospirillales bacterium]|nr:hypothetical protein [Rhodospirillales bacterium]